MSRTSRKVLLPLLGAAIFAAAAGGFAQERGRGESTLWIGNSLVRFRAEGPHPAYDVPEIVEHMRAAAAREGRRVARRGETRVLASDGMGLESWWRSYFGYSRPDGESVSAARAIVEDPHSARRYDPSLGFRALPGSRGWDRIICLSLVNYLDEDEHWYRGRELVPAMERWYAFIREHQPRAEILQYAAPADSRKITRRQDRVDQIHAEMQERFGGRVVPVGRAFLSSMRARPALELRRPENDDFIHFNGRGAYLAAAVFYAVLYDDDPVGLAPPADLGVEEADARFLSTIARDTVAAARTAPR